MSSIPMSASTAALARMAALPALSRQNKSCTKERGAVNSASFFYLPEKAAMRFLERANSFFPRICFASAREPYDSFRLAVLGSFSRGRENCRYRKRTCENEATPLGKEPRELPLFKSWRKQGFPAPAHSICAYLRLNSRKDFSEGKRFSRKILTEFVLRSKRNL